jgi:hypothetical protein
VETGLANQLTLSVRAKGTVAIAPIGDKVKGRTLTYRLTGKTVKIATPAKAGVAPVVRQGARKLKPTHAKKRRRKRLG